MSTNFYLRNKQEFIKTQEINNNVKFKIKEIVEEIKKIVNDEDKVERIKWNLEESVEVGYEKIHIGKRSSGWKPSFEKQEQFSSVRELKIFYHNNQDKYEIVDEYNRVYDWGGLVKELITWNPNGKEDIHDSYKDEEGYIWHKYEFI
ncbi:MULTISPECIES: hypothetical protein [Bacillus cereus group]|uniref:Uncharacterized protein n=1 Tax=Bacillus thuringiensis TaxID=1428 RepID=A0A9X6ZPL1_BACTU|nr:MULTISPECIES: hypothetical protein [Bacillus cereus group]PFJ28951.1 hypothetical protein COJ15_32295 [Bacillus thuringiensis]PGP14553.1 hypothetical protein COA01_29770 [Bacillus cereus]